ncbi:MAG: CARDB domain-containing protein [Phycisphaerales bacterium]
MRLRDCFVGWFGSVKKSLLIGAPVAALAASGASAGAQEIYSTDFESGAGAEWSSSVVDSSNASFTAFSGRFGNQTQTLTLDVTPGEPASVVFDLYVIDTWDGDGCSGGGGPDYFGVRIGGETVFFYTFENVGVIDCQTYPGTPDVSGSDLGFGGFADSIYRDLTIEFVPDSGTATIEFFGQDLQELSDESWGIDNVRVLQSAASGPVVVNGDFELSVPNRGTGNGWTAQNNDGSGGWRSTNGNPGGTFILNSNGSIATDPTIWQDVSGFVVGESYVVLGDYAVGNVGAAGAPNALAVDVDGVTLFTGPATGSASTWVPFATEPFVATAETMEVRLRGEVNGSDNDPRIDNVRVIPAGELQQRVLVVNINGPYNADGQNIHNTLTNAGVDSTYVNLSSNGLVANLLAVQPFDQIWVFDLSASGNDGSLYALDWQAMADWFNADPSRGIICDGRMISSYWQGRWQTEGQNLSENYFENLSDAGGGLVLGTDHNAFHPGINTLNSLIGLEPFFGNFSLTFIPVDTEHPLMTTPNDMGSQLFNDSSPGQTPFGVQPNGRILYTVAWHSGNTATPGISTTISGALNAQVSITSPANGAQFLEGEAISFVADVVQAVEPYTVTWTAVGASVGTVKLGVGDSIVVDSLLPDSYTVTALVEDAEGSADSDSISLGVNPAPNLVITAISAPCAVTQGETALVSWTIENIGSAPAVGPWTDRVLFSLDQSEGNDFVLADVVFNGTIEPGGSAQGVLTGTIPGGIPFNSGYLAVLADSNDDVDESVGEGDNLHFNTELTYLNDADFVTLFCWEEFDYAGNGSAGNWVVASNGLSVDQTVNGEPTYFISDFELVDANFAGTFRVNTSGDDDFIGFAFGFTDLGAESSHYLLTWKQLFQNPAPEGAKLLRIDGIPTATEIWNGVDSAHVTVLAQNTGAGTGWDDFVTYEFFLSYQENGSIRIIIQREDNGALVWDTGIINDPDPIGGGRVGFFNYSQSNVNYAGFTSAPLAPPTAVAGGAYQFNASTSVLTLDATGSEDPDAIEEGLFNGIFGVQWDLGADGIDGIDPTLTEPMQALSLADAAAKGLSVSSNLALSLTVTDADGLTGDDVAQISYANSPPMVAAGGPYPKVFPGQTLELAGTASDPDLSQPVGEALVVEWDTTIAGGLPGIGNGFASSAAASVPYATLVNLVPSKVSTIFLNAGDHIGAIASDSVQIELAAANLVAGAPALAAEVTAGSTVPVSFDEQNAGDADAAGGRVARLYLSTDAAFSPGSDVLLKEIALPGVLAGGAVNPVSTEVVIPAGTSGPRFVIAVVDAGGLVPEPFGGEGDNTTATAVQVNLEPRADLAVLSVQPSASQVEAGTGVMLSWTVKNEGNKPASVAWLDAVFLSDDQTIGPGDTQLLLTPANAAPLAPGQEYVRSATVPIADDFVGGQKYLIVRTDNGNAVLEIGESNNTLAAPIEILPTPAPDLADVQITSGPGSAVFGEQVTVAWSAANIGTEILNSVWSDAVALSTDTVLAPGDILLGTRTINVGPLEPGGAGYSESLTATIPLNASVTPGQYYILVRADGGGSVTELSETNNTAAFGPIQVDLPPLPDLIVEGLTAPSQVTVAQPIEVMLDVTNNGGADASASFDVLLYAKAPGAAGNGTLIGVSNVGGGLAVGASTPVTIGGVVPEVGGLGVVFTVCVDPGNAVLEANESNNCQASGTVPYLRPDLSATDVTFGATVTAGTSASFSVMISNTGPVSANPSPAWFDSVYLSVDNQVGSDALIGSAIRVTPAGSGSSYTANITAGIPESFSGTYWVIAQADRTNAVIESNEGAANFFVSPMQVTVVQPDRPNLVVSALQAVSTGVVGAPMQIDYEITNIGPAATSGFFVDRIHASIDQTLSPGDIALGDSQFVGTLLPGESVQRSVTVKYPPVPGNFFFIVQTDATGTINEGYDGQENDNLRVAGAATLVENFEATAVASVNPGSGGSLTTVDLTGTAFVAGTAMPAGSVPVEIRITNQGFVRKLSALADAAGNFSATFVPAKNEAGIYAVGAGPAPEPSLPVSDQFQLFGIDVTPKSGPGGAPLAVQVFPGQPATGNLLLKNLGDNQVTGIQVATVGLPPRVTVEADLGGVSTLGPLGSVNVPLSILAEPGAEGAFPLDVVFTTTEGATVTAKLAVVIAEPMPNLLPPPSSQLSGGVLKAGMLVGEITFVEFTISNTGGVPTEPIEIQIPPAPWLSVVSQNPIAPIPAGGSAAVTLRLSPDANLPLGPYNGSINVFAGNTGFVQPFEFTAVSDGVGSIEVRVTDEFSYYDVPPGEEPDPTTPNGPKVAFAEVKIRDLATNQIVAQGFSDTEGLIQFDGLEEKFYKVEVTAEDHGNFQSAVKVNDGQVAFVDAFLPLQLVTYQWQVIPTEIEDEYIITIQAEFEAFVPAPVVVVEPTYVNLNELPGPVAQIEFTLTNYGLITAEDVSLDIPEQVGSYTLIPLIDEIGNLPGGCTPGNPSGPCTVTVPVLVVQNGDGGDSGGCTSGVASACYQLECGPASFEFCTGATLSDSSRCGGGGGGGGIIFIPPGGGFPGGGGGCGFCPPPPGYVPPSQPTIFTPVPCDKCVTDCALAAAGCIPGAGCPIGVGQCVGGIVGNPMDTAGNVLQCSKAGLNCAVSLTPGLSQLSCACSLIANCFCLSSGDGCGNPCSPGDALAFLACKAAGLFDGEGEGEGEEELTPEAQFYEETLLGYLAPFAIYRHILGDDAWLSWGQGEQSVFASWNDAFSAAIEDGSDAGIEITESERANLLAIPRPSTVTDEIVHASLDRWNLSVERWSAGILEGDPEEFITADLLETFWAVLVDAQEKALSLGFTDYIDAYSYATEVLIADVTSTNSGTCATVVIEIEQTLTLTRSAFEASLLLENQTDTSLDAVTVDLFIRDTNGDFSNDLFAGSDEPVLAGIGAIDGTEALPAGASCSTTWTLIPFDEAAPLVTTTYFVSGSLSYFLNGSLVEVPLFPVPISVVPNPSLELKYFLETDVFSDDPFTPEIEPAVPFSLGLLIANNGAGVAKDLSIESSQPKIIENESGLVIDFDIVGTRLDFEPIAPSLKVNFGDLAANSTATAQWIMVSSLQGEFVSYSAEFEHVSPFAQPELSLIESVDIFGLEHVVFDDEPSGFDQEGQPIPPIQKPAFLTNDFPDVDDLADTVHLPDGSTAPVTTLTSAGVSTDLANLQATVTVEMPDGYAYLRLDDPFNAAYPLKSVQRTDGKQIVFGYNAWQTSRIIRALGEPDITERLVHIFDSNGPGEYVLSFDPDGVAPEVESFLAVADHGGTGLEQVTVALDPLGLVSDPRSEIRELVVIFDEPVDPSTVSDASVFVEGFFVGDVPVEVPAHSVELRSGDLVAAITFDEPLPDAARYCVQLVGVSDLAGNLLSGESSLLRFSALLGDATGDLRVNNTDVGGVLSLSGTDPIDPSNPFHVRSDINRDGRIDFDDVQLVLDNRGNGTGSISNPCINIEGPPGDSAKPGEGGGSLPPMIADRPGTGRPNDLGATRPLPGDGPTRRPGADADGFGNANGALAEGNGVDGDGFDGGGADGAGAEAGPGAGSGEPVGLANIDGRTLAIDGHWIAVRSLGDVGDAMDAGAGDEPVGADPVALLDAYGFDVDRVLGGDVPGWVLAPLPLTLRDGASRASLGGALLAQGGFVSPLLIDTETGALSALEGSIVITTIPRIPGEWMDTVLSAMVPAGAAVESLGLDASTQTLSYRIDSIGTAESVLSLARSLGERRELASVVPALAGPMLAMDGEVDDASAASSWAAGDLNRDGAVDSRDLEPLLNAFGRPADAADAALDLNADGAIDSDDLDLLIGLIEGAATGEATSMR